MPGLAYLKEGLEKNGHVRGRASITDEELQALPDSVKAFPDRMLGYQLGGYVVKLFGYDHFIFREGVWQFMWPTQHELILERFFGGPPL